MKAYLSGSATLRLAASVLLSATLLGGIGSEPAVAVQSADDRLSSLIQTGLRAGGPFFTSQERAVIERQCGYAPGEWDGHDFQMMNDVLYCKNGRRVDDPEVRAVMKQAQPRIGKRVNAVMESAAVQAAIGQVASEATEKALRQLTERYRR